MKNNIKFSLLIACTIFMSSHCIGQININKISNKVKSQIPKQKKEGSSALSNDQVIKGLKEQNMSIILSQSELNHTEDIFDKQFIIERGENVK